MSNIYDYTDYRKFVKDRIDGLRQENPRLSFRNLNKRFGLKSSGFINTIISGERNLGRCAINNICRGLELNEKEARFFEVLVHFNQAKTAEEKEYFYNRLISCYPMHRSKVLDEKYYKLFANWYYAAILELVRTTDFNPCPEWISKRLKPNVPASMVSAALKDLEEAGLISRDGSGRLIRTDHMIATPDVVNSLSLLKFHEQLHELSMNALKGDLVEDKEYSTLTVAASKSSIQKLKKKIQEFQSEIITLLESCNQEKTDVVHINMQLFKLTNGEAR